MHVTMDATMNLPDIWIEQDATQNLSKLAEASTVAKRSLLSCSKNTMPCLP